MGVEGGSEKGEIEKVFTFLFKQHQSFSTIVGLSTKYVGSVSVGSLMSM